TSVDLLAPGAPALQLIAHRPRPPAVHFHSVIGVIRPSEARLETWLSGDKEPGDGVVPYPSAPAEAVDPELVLPAAHFHVHHPPLAILELRRILLEHLREADAPGEIIPASVAKPSGTRASTPPDPPPP